MRRKVIKSGKKYIAFALALAMIVQPAANVPFASAAVVSAETVQEETPGQGEPKYIDFEKIEQSDYVDGADVDVKYEGTTATITGTDWGNDWGADSKWQIQLKELVPVTAGEKYDIFFNVTSRVARTIVLKLGDVDNNNAVFLEEVITLEAGVPYTYENTTTAEVDINQLMVLFALGAEIGSEQNTITITDFALRGEKSGWVTLDQVIEPDPVGKEYDFSNTEYNQKNDYADPGTTKDGYELIWADEFDGNYRDGANVDANTGLNLDNWAYQLGDGTTDCSNPGWGNKELQAYTDKEKNLAVNEDLNGDGDGDGLLRITASYEEDGYDYAEESTKKYTSARIRTTKPDGELFNTTYGYIEARMSLPATKGAWPAFWMLPQSTNIYGGWPVSGEIDIMETCGAFGDGSIDKTCSTLHWGAPEHVYKGSGYTQVGASDYTSFHTYAVDWEPGKMTFYYDGEAVYTSENWASGFAGASDKLSFDAPFDQPFYMILNLAVDSGQFGGSVNKATFQDNINMYVDYVRAYQKTEGYPESVERTASGDVNDDWQDYDGQNQIAEIGENNLEADGFASDSSADPQKWYLSCNANGTGGESELTSSTADGKTWAKLAISEAGSQDYSVQLIGHYNAKAGYVYEVSFDAYAEGNIVGKTVNCDSKEWSGWSTYGIQSFALKGTPEHHSFLIDQTEDFDKCRIEFNLGAQDSGTVYIGNVKVEIVDPSLVNRENDRKPLEDGNLIYNSTFDQGNHHIGYWSASEGTTLKVPRYTTEKIADTDVSVIDIASKTNYENIADGVKYYERRAQVSANAGTKPEIYQTDLKMPVDDYKLNFDLYSKEDTKVTVSIYTVATAGEGAEAGAAEETKTLDKKVLTTDEIDYKADGVKNYEWKFGLGEEIKNAALVLTFADGSSVQVDNVTLIGESQGATVDSLPMGPDVTWKTDGCDVSAENGTVVASGITSGTAWYAPQVISSNYGLASGNNYKLTFKYKMEGNSNNTAEYIIQEDKGSYTVFGNGPTKFTYDPSKADADGFCTYETTIPATVSLNNVHMVFGFGNSKASDVTFTFKDVEMKLVEAGDEGDDSGAIKIPGSFAITYILNGGVNAEANPSRYKEGEGLASIAAPTKEGKDFLGWSIEEAGTKYVSSIPETSTGNVVLVANWKGENAELPTITAQPTGKTYREGDTAELTVAATAPEGGTLSYQWYQNTKNSVEGAKEISGATSATYAPSTAAAGTTYYFCKVTNTDETATNTTTAYLESDIAEVVVVKRVDAEVPTITTQPAGKTYTAGATATALTVAATVSDGGTLSYQWYRNTANNTTTGTAIPGATNAAYTPAVSAAGTTYYYCVVTNTNTAVNGTTTATATTNTAAIVVNATVPPKPTTYTVTFNSNGGTSVAAQTVEAGKTAKMPTAPTRSGYTFAGWYNGATAYNFNTPVNSNLTLTAKWTANNQGGNNQGNAVKVTKVKITGDSKKIAAGKKITLKANVTPATATNKKVKWKSSNTKYATVSQSGVVTTKKAGAGKTVTITATAQDGSNKKATYKITIMNKAVKKVKLTAKTKTVKAGKKLTVKASVTLTGKIYKKSKSTKANKTLAWKSSNKKYATVNSKGVVSTKKAGKGKTVTITATATDGSKKKATIKIKLTK